MSYNIQSNTFQFWFLCFFSSDLFQKLPLCERPLLLRLVAGPDPERLSFVLKENETGEVEVIKHTFVCDDCTLLHSFPPRKFKFDLFGLLLCLWATFYLLLRRFVYELHTDDAIV